MIWPNVLDVNLPWTLALLLFGTLEYLMPELTRQNVMFSVTAPRELMPSARAAVVRGYRRILTASIVVALVTVLASSPLLSRWSGGAAFAIEYVGFAVGFSIARRQVRTHAIAAASIREADLNERDPSSILVVVFAIPLLAISSVALWTYSHWGILPDPYPIHWTLALEPDTWVPRTPLHVYGLLGLLTGATALVAILCCGLLFWSRRINAGRRPERSGILAIVLMLLAEYVMAATAMLPLGFSANGTDLAVFIALTGASTYLIVIGRGGVFVDRPSESNPAGDTTPDSAWKLGLVYFNPDDPALFVHAQRFPKLIVHPMPNRFSSMAHLYSGRSLRSRFRTERQDDTHHQGTRCRTGTAGGSDA